MSGVPPATSMTSSESASSGTSPSRRGKKDDVTISAVISGSEPTWLKAYRLLVEGKVRVTFVNWPGPMIHATVTGDNGEYYVDFGLTRKERWTCSCPARVDCSHLRAVQQVTTEKGME